MKVFLTGGAGFIGSHIADSLVQDGHETIIYDDFSSGHKDNIKNVMNSAEIVEGDVLDKEKLFDICPENVDVISHQAAQLEIFGCIDDPVMDLTTNAAGTINILELARRKNVSKVIIASSACVYGQAKYIPQDEEKHPTMPNWPYGASKLVAEHYARIYMESYGIRTVNLRYGIVYGPREWYGRVLTMFLCRIYNGLPPVVFGKGECLRDFVSVHDVVDFHNKCLTNDDVVGKSLNVGTGLGTSVRDLAEMVCRILTGGEMEPIYEDVPEGKASSNMPTRRRIPRELKQMVLACELGNKILGFQARVSLDKGIREEYEWLCKNPDRWDMNGMVRV